MEFNIVERALVVQILEREVRRIELKMPTAPDRDTFDELIVRRREICKVLGKIK
jgi:hypothetical protein